MLSNVLTSALQFAMSTQLGGMQQCTGPAASPSSSTSASAAPGSEMLSNIAYLSGLQSSAGSSAGPSVLDIRDAQIADFAAAGASTNALQSFASSMLGGGSSPAAYPPQTQSQGTSEAPLQTAMTGFSSDPSDDA